MSVVLLHYQLFHWWGYIGFFFIASIHSGTHSLYCSCFSLAVRIYLIIYQCLICYVYLGKYLILTIKKFFASLSSPKLCLTFSLFFYYFFYKFFFLPILVISQSPPLSFHSTAWLREASTRDTWNQPPHPLNLTLYMHELTDSSDVLLNSSDKIYQPFLPDGWHNQFGGICRNKISQWYHLGAFLKPCSRWCLPAEINFCPGFLRWLMVLGNLFVKSFHKPFPFLKSCLTYNPISLIFCSNLCLFWH